MLSHIRKADLRFSLLLAYFLIWRKALAMPELSWHNVGRVVGDMLFVALLLEIVLVLVGILRHKPLFGRAKSVYFSWRRVLPVSVVVSGLYALLSWITLPAPVGVLQLRILAVLAVGGCIALMLYMYGLVSRSHD
ncbi:MAG: hypothetical protein J1F13_04710 [Prevotellaceae bacterium]|nr:hypothetical protein [Prevotellaceae bacterium]